MTSHSPFDRRPQRSSTPSRLILAAAAAAVLALAATAATSAALAAPTAPAAPAAPFAFSGGEAGTGGSGATAADLAPAARRLLQAVPWRRPSAAAARILPPAGLQTLVSRPKDGGTGLFITDPIHGTWGDGQADLMTAAVENLNTSGSSGDLVLSLWATATVPVDGQGITGFNMASFDLGSLPAGDEFSDVDSGEIAYAAPANHGCYYVSLVLLENNQVADVRPFTSGGTLSAAQTNGFVTFPFLGTAGEGCTTATVCTRTATSACLLSSRFQVSAAYDNTTTGIGSGTVLSFGGTRAESDESVFFYFTDPSNFEMGAKILDACSFASSFWVFIGGLTNQGWGLDVLDTQTGNHKYYVNNEGTTTVTITDTAALPCP